MVAGQSHIPWPPPASSRRNFLKVACGSALAIGTSAGLASCSSITSAIGAIGNAFDRIFGHDWLRRLAIAIAATEITNILNGGLEGTAWAAWDTGVETLLEDALAAIILTADSRYVAGTRGAEPVFPPGSMGKQKGFIPGNVGWAQMVPPVVMAQVSKTRHGDPRTDELVACVDTGKTNVIFKPWAWQTLWLYVRELTKNRTGAELETMRTLCLRRLIPSGRLPNSAGNTLTYQALDGTVVIELITGSGGTRVGVIISRPAPGIRASLLEASFNLPTS